MPKIVINRKPLVSMENLPVGHVGRSVGSGRYYLKVNNDTIFRIDTRETRPIDNFHAYAGFEDLGPLEVDNSPE